MALAWRWEFTNNNVTLANGDTVAVLLGRLYNDSTAGETIGNLASGATYYLGAANAKNVSGYVFNFGTTGIPPNDLFGQFGTPIAAGASQAFTFGEHTPASTAPVGIYGGEPYDIELFLTAGSVSQGTIEHCYQWKIGVPDRCIFVCDEFSLCTCPYVSGGQARKMVTAITGLDHLDGEKIKVQVDGALPSGDNEFTPDAGAITLPEKAAVVHAGLGYDGTIQLLKSSGGSQAGTGQTKDRRIFLAVLRLYRTLGLKIGLDEDHLNQLIDGDPALPLITGDKDKLPNTLTTKEAELIIKQDKPLPATILAAITRSEVEERV